VTRTGSIVCALWLALAADLAGQTPDFDTGPGAGTIQFLELSGGRSVPQPIEAGRVPLLRRRISLVLKGAPLEDALAEIGRLAGVSFVYGGAQLPAGERVTLRAEAMTLAAVLTETLLDAGVDVVVTGGDRLALVRHGQTLPAPVVADGTITGVVSDSATGDPVDGAEALLDTLNVRGVSNAAGVFRMTAPVGHHLIRVRRLGYRPATVEVDVEEDREVAVAVRLVPQVTRLEELVSTATGVRRRYELGNSIISLNVDSIVETQPVHSLSQLLETRVPGLTATHTSGAPGDPTRLRLRGLSSVTRSNDPIVIVDGVRVYADQSDVLRGANLAVVNGSDGRPITGRPNVGESLTQKVAVPSPLDQIPVHSIDHVEIFMGPSAATLYGADAANGVIVVTLKHGQAGPARWNFGTDIGFTHQPGKYPDSYFRFGHDPQSSAVVRCPLVAYSCQVDSLVRFQALNDPNLTIFGGGTRRAVNMGVNGGTERVTYAVDGAYTTEDGLLKLPNYEAQRYSRIAGEVAPDWMEKPQGFDEWSASGHVSVQVSSKADFSFTSSINHSMQRRSTLDQQLSGLMAMYADTARSRFYTGGQVSTGPGSQGDLFNVLSTEVSDFRTRATAEATSFTEGAHLGWRPLGWLTATADVGLNVIDRNDRQNQPRFDFANDEYRNNDVFGGNSYNFNGFINEGNGHSTVITTSLGAVSTFPLPRSMQLRTAIGANYVQNKTNDLIAAGQGLIPGATGIDGATVVITTPQRSEVTTFGWYIEPTLSNRLFYLTAGFRLDASDTYGSQESQAGFPKLSLSYLVSQERFFPFKKLFSTLRLRAAYGQAGVQPGPGDRLRLFSTSPGSLDGVFGWDQSALTTLGNVNLKPERSSEFEGGVDADFFGDKMTVEVTAYNKTRRDALVPLQLPPSVNGGGTVLVNVGRVRNRGYNVVLRTSLLRGNAVSLGTYFHVSRNKNVVLSTGEAGAIRAPGGYRVVEGYPLLGRWAKPIVHFADANNDGIIARSEVQLGDEEVFLGPQEPNYEADLATDFVFARGLVTVSAGFQYTDGQLQVNDAVSQAPFTVRALNDPSAPLAEQAAAVVRDETPYGLSQLVSTFRFNSLAIGIQAPERIAGMFGARSMSFTIQGTNLGLRTNYRGKDPAVNAYATGNVISDTGQLPLPRTWSFGLRFGL
jgi:outer membrane receptor for ferrienterochelin and colicin